MVKQMILFDTEYAEKQREDAFVQQALKRNPNHPRFDSAFWHKFWQDSNEFLQNHPDNMKPKYTLLGIEPGATKREIYNAYRRKARKLHPDAGGDAEEFKQLYAAYRELLTVANKSS